MQFLPDLGTGGRTRVRGGDRESRRADDPVALRSERLFRTFADYLAWRMSFAFRGLRVSRAGLPPPETASARQVILYTNHPSWWDPAVCMILSARLFPGRPGFGPMDDEAFRRYGIFRRMGVFGIALDTRAGARRFLETSERALAVPGAMMWITAEGQFTDPRSRPVRLRAGIAHLARRVPNAVLVPLALSYEFWNESRPEALVRFGTPILPADAGDVRGLGDLLSARLGATMDALALETATRNPALFTTVVRGRAGSDMIYDGWRRARALLKRERFDPAHEETRW